MTLDPAKPSPNPNPRPNQGALRCLLDMRDAAYAYVRHDDRKVSSNYLVSTVSEQVSKIKVSETRLSK